jgi:hypothetical protein
MMYNVHNKDGTKQQFIQNVERCNDGYVRDQMQNNTTKNNLQIKDGTTQQNIPL